MNLGRVRLLIVLSAMAALASNLPAQVRRVNSDEIMDAAQDMTRAAEQADKLAPEGSQFCGWTVATLDASDLQVAISRYLLNRGSTVPGDIPASRMWQVSLVAHDLAHQLVVSASQCDLEADERARRIASSARSIFMKFIAARMRFEQLAYQQTRAQEETGGAQGSAEVDAEGQIAKVDEVGPSDMLGPLRDVKDASLRAEKVEAAAVRDCKDVAPTATAAEMAHLDDLLGLVESNPATHKHIPAANLWAATWGPEATMWDVYGTTIACTPLLGQSGKSLKKRASTDMEAIQAFSQLNKTIAAVAGLALVQTEWEESSGAKIPALQEQ